jgi:hypothetical protein
VTLTGYEMQWTVAYFRYKSRIWDMLPGSGISRNAFPGQNIHGSIRSGVPTGTIDVPILTAGAVAYRRRKLAMWEDLMTKADSIFGKGNISYNSPL